MPFEEPASMTLKPSPFDIGPAHLVGIGGIGMSGIAEVMHNLGYKVQGSDVAEGYVVEGLRAKGIKVMIGHKAENLGDAAVVVTSTAIKRGNPEVELALENRVPVNIWDDINVYFGGVHSVIPGVAGTGDPRRGGSVVMVEV